MRYFTEVYKKFPKDPEIIKRAKAIAHTLKNMTIFIRDDELLVGNETSKNLGEKINLELYSYDNIFDKKSTIKKYERRKLQPFFLQENEIEEILDTIPFWKGKSVYGEVIPTKLLEKNFIHGTDRISANAPNIAIAVGTNEGHICFGYAKLLKKGYRGIINDAKAFQQSLEQSDPEYQNKYNFYEAVKIYYDAAIEFSMRFSNLATRKSLEEPNEQRKKELIVIAEMMKKFTNDSPDSFYEAIQFIHFTQNIANIIFDRSVIALGRLDQILWSYYHNDLKEKKLTEEFALELIEELNLKLTWNCTLLPTDYTSIANALGLNTQTITISGMDKQGKDATNEISYLFLKAYENIKAFTTDLSIRIHKNTPEDFFKKAIKVFKSTSGIAFYNDDIIIDSLKKAGYQLEDARDYALIGCVEPSGQGNTFAATGRMFLNLPGVLELTLNNGYSLFTQKLDGLNTGDPASFLTFSDLMDAFKKQLIFNIEKSAKIAELGDKEFIKYLECPFVSASIDGCMQNGKDYVSGGAKYNYSSITAYGFATLVDSIYNIKKVVYEENLISLTEFIEFLNSDFENQEVFRQKLINKYQKWGNDKDDIDSLANDLWTLYTREVAKQKSIRGGRYNAGAYSMGIHVMEGFLTGSTADGRKARQPISNSLSPVNNVEKSGITAILNSLAKLNYEFAANGVALNVRIHPQNLEKNENIGKFYNLLKSYFDSGGMQIQPTAVSTETLRDAQKFPEKYPDLIVKVGGYNATFIDLGTPIQNDIIDRLENVI